MECIEIESDRIVIEEFWTLDDEVQIELLIKAIRGSREYGREPNKEWYHGMVVVDGHDDLLDVTYHNSSKAILWRIVDQLDIKHGLINCGERNVQRQYRIVLRDICERHGIKEGDAVEVSIKVVKK